jgi:Na+/glutamate symporter
LLAEGPASGVTISDATAVIGLLITIGGIAGGYLIKYLLQRRSTTGKVTNSAADILWSQAQQMREMLLAEKQRTEEQLDKVAEQRDRLLDSHATQILPTLAAVNESLEQIAKGIQALLAKTDEILQRGGPPHDPVPGTTAPHLPDDHRSASGAG